MVKQLYQCGIVNLTNIKKDALDCEYDNLQTFLQTEKDNGLYSANKQQALRFYKRKKLRNYPLSIRNDLIRVEKRDTEIAQFWVRIPVKKVRGGCWLPIKPHKQIDLDSKICESKIIRKEGNYVLHLVTEKDVPLRNSYSNLIALDLGIRNVATSVEFATGKTKFYGKGLRRIRGHYFHLRKRLGNKKALKTIKKVGSTEKRRVNDELHKISREIVDEAKEKNAVIVLGILSYVRKRRGQWRKKSMRKLSSMPSHKLTQMILYKAEQEGVRVIETYEGYTSKTCNNCGEYGIRNKQGLFRCPYCGYEDNADRNGAINIGKRALRYICNVGATVDLPELKIWKQSFHHTLEAT